MNIVDTATAIVEREMRSRQPYEAARIDAPEPLALIPTSTGHILISRYWACPDESLVSYEDHQRPLSAEARERLHHDMHLLDEHALLHPYVGRGLASWLVAETSGMIALSDWGAMRPLLDAERGEMLARLDQLLARAAGMP